MELYKPPIYPEAETTCLHNLSFCLVSINILVSSSREEPPGVSVAVTPVLQCEFVCVSLLTAFVFTIHLGLKAVHKATRGRSEWKDI